MIEFKINVDNVDYKSIVRFVLPLMSEKIKNNANLSFLNELLSNTTVTDNVVSAVLDNIPEEMKNNMVKSAVACYSDKILSAVNQAIRDKGIVANISDIELLSNTTVTNNVVSAVPDNIPEGMKNNTVKSMLGRYGDKILSAANKAIIAKAILESISDTKLTDMDSKEKI